ncbi:type II secretion system protein [bacterium]|nr:type II secretion system protein [bacterium]
MDFLPSPLGEGRKKAAFTLAEVLITLGIIGVVAALTMPMLIQSYQERTTVSRVKKMYTTLANAYNLYLAEDNHFLETTANPDDATKVADIFKPYLNISKDCGTSSTACLANLTYKLKNGGDSENYSADNIYYKLLLNDGSTLWFRGKQSNEDDISGVAFFDTNGNNPPNKWGHDVFALSIKRDRLAPARNFNSHCSSERSTGWGCIEWILIKDNMEYLHKSGLSL